MVPQATDAKPPPGPGGTNGRSQKRTLLEIARELAVNLESSARNGFPIERQDLEQIESLYKLDQIRQRQTRRWGQWVVVAIMLLGLVAIVVLKTRVWWATEVELDLRVSGFRATSTASQPLWDGIAVSEATIQPIQELQLFPDITRPDDLGTSTFASVVASDSGKIHVGPVRVQAGERFALEAEGQGVYRVSADSVMPRDVRLGLEGPAKMRVDKWSIEVPPDSTRRVTIVTGAGATKLEILPAAGMEEPLLQHLRVRDLAFVQVRHVIQTEPTAEPVEVPTLLGGQIVFPAIGGIKKQVSPLETLEFGSVEGTLRWARSSTDGIQFGFVGKARKLSMGTMEITPTLFEYLAARNDWWLLWGVGAYVIALVAALRNWWRGT